MINAAGPSDASELIEDPRMKRVEIPESTVEVILTPFEIASFFLA